MLLAGQILTGSTTTINTKKGGTLQKTRLKVLDLGPEASGGDLYWVDFLGEAALGDEEMRQVARQQVQVEVRSMRASAGSKGGAFLNATGRRGEAQRPGGPEGPARRGRGDAGAALSLVRA